MSDITSTDWVSITLDPETERDIKLKSLGFYLAGLDDGADADHIIEQLEAGETSGTCYPEEMSDQTNTWCPWEPFEHETAGDILELADIANDVITGIVQQALYRARTR
jgi:ribulose bisphosphate carboxylase small subunit